MSDKNANAAEARETAVDAEAERAPEAQPGDGDAPGAPEAGAAGPVDPAAVQAEVIAQLERECATLKDKLLRALAEAENTRRRAERDRRDAETYGGTRLARDLLAVHDNLDRALAHVDDSLRAQAQGFIEGVELTQRELLNAFAKHKIEKVKPEVGEKFDPNRHQAMFEAPIPGAEPGTVIEVMQAGFTVADRLLRPAMVGVARAEPKAEAPADQEAEAAPDDDGADEATD